jgi:glycosyltransferase involved in cell wall biosynthesis
MTDVRPLLAGSNISVLASTAETFSIAMLESLAMEVPVVATDIGGASEAIQNGQTGLLVPPDDVTALASAIEHLIKDQRVRRQMGQSGRDFIKRRFTQRGMRAATSEVLKSVKC